MKKTIAIWITVLMLMLELAVPMFHSALAKPAPDVHPEYHDAINDLRNARKHLEHALPDGYGHRDRAIRAIDGAIRECDEAIRILH